MLNQNYNFPAHERLEGFQYSPIAEDTTTYWELSLIILQILQFKHPYLHDVLYLSKRMPSLTVSRTRTCVVGTAPKFEFENFLRRKS